MKLKQDQATIQQLQQQLQQMQMMIKQRQDIESVKQEAETKRELMRQTTKGHDTDTRAQTAMQETMLETQTRKEIEDMKAQLAILLSRINKTAAREAEAEAVERGI